jgi:hypothetical protein
MWMALYAYDIAAMQSVLIGRQKASMKIVTYFHSQSFILWIVCGSQMTFNGGEME